MKRKEIKRNSEGQIRKIVKVLTLTLLFPLFSHAFDVGYKKGFFIRDNNFSLKTNFKLQVKGEDKWEKSADPQNKAGVEIKRARIVFSGYAFSPKLRYKFQLTLEGEAMSLRDAIVEYKIIGNVLSIVAGQYKVPFEREYLTSSTNLELVDKSIVRKYFYAGRDVGISLAGVLGGGSFAYAVGVFNGEGKNVGFKSIDSSGLYAVRIGFATNKGYEKGIWHLSQGAFSKDKKGTLKVSTGFLYGDVKDAEQFGKRKDLSKFMANLQAPAHFYEITGDVVFKYHPVSFEGQFNYANSNITKGIWGYRLQASSFVYGDYLQLAGRFGYVNDAENSKEIKEITGGISWYISHTHSLKLQNDYVYSWWGDEKEFVARLQLQVKI